MVRYFAFTVSEPTQAQTLPASITPLDVILTGTSYSAISGLIRRNYIRREPHYIKTLFLVVWAFFSLLSLSVSYFGSLLFFPLLPEHEVLLLSDFLSFLFKPFLASNVVFLSKD